MDAHFHIYELNKFPEYGFPTPDMPPQINRDVTIEDYEKATATTPIKGGVFVQVANDCPAEITWLCELAKTHPIIKGVVGGLSIGCGVERLASEIDKAKQYPVFVGARYILNYEDADVYLTLANVHEGLALLADRNLTFDLVLYPTLIPKAIDVARKFPNLKLVVNHCAKPAIREGGSPGWVEGMKKLAEFPNVSVKISGLVTEATLGAWTVDEMRPFVQNVVDWFGPERCMFGSDWPVCLLNADSFSSVYDASKSCLPTSLTEQELKGIMEDNCLSFYGIHL